MADLTDPSSSNDKPIQVKLVLLGKFSYCPQCDSCLPCACTSLLEDGCICAIIYTTGAYFANVTFCTSYRRGCCRKILGRLTIRKSLI